MTPRRRCLGLLLALPLAGCLTSPGQLAKMDIDRIADLHRREAFASLKRLTEKLYRRNPREWKKGGHASLEVALAQLSEPSRVGLSPESGGRRSATLLLAGLRDDYPSDRVAAFAGGLGNMLFDAFDGKAEYFILDDLDAQKLYNAARNVEIAAWKLANARRTQPEADIPAGAPILLSNEMAPVQNLSFEREFGRLIGSLDLLSQIAADKSNRTIVKVVHNLATAVFLPIPGLK
ncbi:MAG: hypothetical protein Q8L56_13385 [Rhodocyclaceae bacterium]|nr:hypothetical protein [Rhodocyclaceae bacterium]